MSLKDDKNLIERIDKYGHNLEPRESDFIESCVRRLEMGLELSPAQRKWAETIEEKRVD